MQTPVYHFPVSIRRKGVFPLALFVKGQDLFTRQVSYLDLSDAIVTWTIRNTPSDLVGSSEPGGALEITLETSRIDWLLSQADTQALTVGPHAYRVRAALSSGEIIPLLDGTIIVED